MLYQTKQTGPDCATLNPDLDCNICTEDDLGAGTVTPTNGGKDCGGTSGTCMNGVCTGGK